MGARRNDKGDPGPRLNLLEMIIYCIVTNDLNFDQRMIRIATTLSENGYVVKLVGRRLKNSVPLVQQPFLQKRIPCFFTKGKLFYGEFNLRIFFYLLFKKMDCICAIDLDTILPCYFISKMRRITRVYDAHELFCEMKEVVTRPAILKIWKGIEKFTVPRFTNGYTVSSCVADALNAMYGVQYDVIRNVTVLRELQHSERKEIYVLYQGAVNEGRSLETLIPAMHFINVPLIICGDGNLMQKAKELVRENGLGDKIQFKGYVLPGELQSYTRGASVGINLVDDGGLNNYYSLANRFFDYMHAGVPQLCADIPAYREINAAYEIAVLISDLSSENIAKQLNTLLTDKDLYLRLQNNCLQAKKVFNWQYEEKKLIQFYKNILPG